MRSSFLAVMLTAVIFAGCAIEQKKPAGPAAPPPPPRPSRGVELSGEISAALDSLERPGLTEEERKAAMAAAEALLSRYFELTEEELGEPRLQGSIERLLDTSREMALAANLAPEKPTDEAPSPKDDILGVTTFLSPDELKETLKEVELSKQRVQLGIPIPLDNEAVLSYVRLYKTKYKKWFTGALERSVPLEKDLKAIFRDEGIPPELIYLGIVESAFRPNVRSRAGALGMWQFMEGTAKRYGLRIDFWEDERLDPWKSSRASAKYLSFLYSTFGDWNIALASYNCGEGKFMRYLRKHPKGDFWSARKSKVLKRETREYVPAILASILIASDPGSFGITPAPQPAQEPSAALTIEKQVDMRALARGLDLPVEVLMAMNPSLKRIVTPPRPFDLKVPAREMERAEAWLASGEQGTIEYTVHTVRKGENIKTIARKYKMDPAELAALNIGLGTRLRRNTQLLVMKGGAPATAVKAPEGGAPVAAKEEKKETAETEVHVVRKGDTLGRIAGIYGSTVEEICRANRITPRTTLRIGMKLVIP